MRGRCRCLQSLRMAALGMGACLGCRTAVASLPTPLLRSLSSIGAWGTDAVVDDVTCIRMSLGAIITQRLPYLQPLLGFELTEIAAAFAPCKSVTVTEA